ncbi:MAG: putative endonuclease [Verrucomicrobiales bacterium]|jgi:putative endonuclease
MGLVDYIEKRLGRSLDSPLNLRGDDGKLIASREIGALGERLGAKYLKSLGFRILMKNFRAQGGGEVDIVCRDDKRLVFVEVKTRTSLKRGRPIEAVTKDKQYLITRGALEWLARLDRPYVHYRFDVLEVMLRHGEPANFNLVRFAFETPEPYYYG